MSAYKIFFALFTRKHLRRNLLFDKVVGWTSPENCLLLLFVTLLKICDLVKNLRKCWPSYKQHSGKTAFGFISLSKRKNGST